jgi:hypothetical protein
VASPVPAVGDAARELLTTVKEVMRKPAKRLGS